MEINMDYCECCIKETDLLVSYQSMNICLSCFGYLVDEDLTELKEYEEDIKECDCKCCENTQELHCTHCSGSGEGMHDGSTCSFCRGIGVMACPDCLG